MNPPQLYYVNQNEDDIFVPNNYKQQLTLWNEHHLNQGLTQRYSLLNTSTSSTMNSNCSHISSSSSSAINGCDEIHELDDDNEENCGAGENDIVLIKVI